jgi:lipopolysaccharide biosynthesis glycosyltransferase
MNKIVVIANERFEPGLVAFINSYKKANIKSPLCIIDTGLKNSYPYETTKKNLTNFSYKKASWMSDCSPYLQLELGDIKADKIIYLETDMLLLKNIDHLFDEININCDCISVMDDAAFSSLNYHHIDSAGRYYLAGELNRKYSRIKGFNGGLIGGTHSFFNFIQEVYSSYLKQYENQYRLLAQSLLNQIFIEENLIIKDIGLEYNFSGINEYYKDEYLYTCLFNENRWEVIFNGINISIVHFTGKNKPFLVSDKNIMTPVWEYYYNNGELF